MKRYLIAFDSNLLYKSYKSGGDFSIFKLNNSFEELIHLIKLLKLTEYVSIGLPQIVLEELIQQQAEFYIQTKDRILSDLKNFKIPGLDYKFDEESNYINFLNNKKEEYIQKFKLEGIKIEVLPLPNDDKLTKIISKAIKKLPPFEGTLKKSDKGFKDAVIWESIIKYKNKNITEKIFFCTNDNIFHSSFLMQEYKNENRDSINIIKDTSSETIFDQITRKLLYIYNSYNLPKKEVSKDSYLYRDVKNSLNGLKGTTIINKLFENNLNPNYDLGNLFLMGDYNDIVIYDLQEQDWDSDNIDKKFYLNADIKITFVDEEHKKIYLKTFATILILKRGCLEESPDDPYFTPPEIEFDELLELKLIKDEEVDHDLYMGKSEERYNQFINKLYRKN